MDFVGAGLWSALLDALSFAFGMFWEILWALILGFALSAAVQAVVSKAEMRRLLPDDSPRTLTIPAGSAPRRPRAPTRRNRGSQLRLLDRERSARVGASLIVEFAFDGLGLIPSQRNAKVVEAGVALNYTTVLNVIFLGLAAPLLWRYFRHGGGLRMLRLMDEPSGHAHAHGHG